MYYTNFKKHSMIGSDFYPLFRIILVADKSSRDDAGIIKTFPSIFVMVVFITSLLTILKFHPIDLIGNKAREKKWLLQLL